jgi:hypothetical protein
MNRLPYYSSCVTWPSGDVDALTELCDSARDISRRAFLKHVDREDLRQREHLCFYSGHHKQGLTMAGDYHVQYKRGKLHGKWAYFFVWSAIEFVFWEG